MFAIATNYLPLSSDVNASLSTVGTLPSSSGNAMPLEEMTRIHSLLCIRLLPAQRHETLNHLFDPLVGWDALRGSWLPCFDFVDVNRALELQDDFLGTFPAQTGGA